MQEKRSISGRRRMVNWLAVAFSLFIGLGVLLLLTAVYVYQHPETLVRVLQYSVSRTTRMSLSVGELDYGVSPGRLTTKDLRIESLAEPDDLSLTVSVLSLDFSLSGPPGRRILTVRRLRLNNFSARIGTPLSRLEAPSDGGSGFKRILLRLFRYFVFSTVQWEDIRAVNGSLSVNGPDQSLQVDRVDVRTAADGGLQLRGDVKAAWPDQQVAFRGRQLQIVATDRETPSPRSLKITVDLPDGDVDSPQIQIPKLQAAAELRYDSARREIAVSEANLTGRFILQPPRSNTPVNWRLAASGTYAARIREAELHTWRLEIADVLAANGKARARLSPPRHLRLNLSEGRLSAAEFLVLLDALHIARPPLEAAGQIGIRGALGVELSSPTPGPVRGDLTADWPDLEVSYRDDRNVLQARTRGRLQARGDLRRPRFELRASADRISYHSPAVGLSRATAALDVSGDYRDASVDFKIDIPETTLNAGNRHVKLKQLDIRAANGRIRPHNRSIDLPDVRCRAPDMGALTLALTSDLSTSKVRLAGEDSRILQTVVQNGLLPADWHFSAHETFEADLTFDAFTPERLSARFDVDRLGFGNPAGTRIAENIRIQMEADFKAEPQNRFRIARIHLSAVGGEFLWDDHYLSLNTHPVTVAGEMRIDPVTASVRVDRFTGSVAALFSVLASGRMTFQDATPTLVFAVQIPETDLAPVFRHLISEPYRYRYPALETLDIGGTVSGNVEFRKNPAGWSCRGRALWDGGRFSQTKSGIAFSGITFGMPIVYDGDPQTDSSRPASGRLRIRRFSLPFLPQQDLDLRFEVFPDHSATTTPISIDLPSGTAEFGPVRVENVFSADIQLETQLRLESIAIDPFLQDLWSKSTGGILHGQLTQLRLEEKNLTSRGSLSIEVFGGELRLLDPGLEALLSSAPTLVLDARIADLNLGQLTQDTAFGRIQGILQGRIENLEIVHGQTQRFDLHLETVKTEGVPQKINVEAVANIARLGGGQNPFVGLAGKVVAVFDEFYYRKMGVNASLANDMFQVNGTIHEDGKEYLVKKGGIPGVDVVNLNPDNRISFKDMLQRIRRIRSNRSGPVIR